MAPARARMTSMVRRRRAHRATTSILLLLLAIEAAGRRGGQPPRTLAAGHVADFGDDESDATPTRLPCPALLTDDDCYRSRRPGPAGPRRRSVL
jgi:hypothetical protein